jgi:hypothetical protein
VSSAGLSESWARQIGAVAGEVRGIVLRWRLSGVDLSYPYLAQRGIAAATARHFGVGFYDGPGLMRGRMVVPIEDELGQVVAYAGRSLYGREPRYKLPVGFPPLTGQFARTEILSSTASKWTDWPVERPIDRSNVLTRR